MSKERLLTGLQPSGNLTIGNYIGGISQILKYQEEYETYLFVPDMHAITVTQDPSLLHKRIKEVIAIYLAAGVNPEKVHLYVQSENLYHANLSWIFECHSYFGEMSRMHQFKEKSKNHENFTCGLFTYPALMAADILLYDAKYVPTGADQKQHVELARNIADRFNSRYGKDYFVKPEPLIPQIGARIRDLQDPSKKMSKSTDNPKASVFMLDDEKSIKKKFSSAVTDSDTKIFFDEEQKPGVSNLLTLYSVFSGLKMDDVVAKFQGGGYGDLKNEVANIVIESMKPIKEKYEDYLTSGKVDEVLDEGRDYTNKIAKEKYEIIRDVVGLGRK